jgi:hypothetical protein
MSERTKLYSGGGDFEGVWDAAVMPRRGKSRCCAKKSPSRLSSEVEFL